jgi:hypothetical protein
MAGISTPVDFVALGAQQLKIIPYLGKKEKRRCQKLGLDKTPDFWYNIIESAPKK